MNNLLHIGTIELVTLPDNGIRDVPAKVDTGADSSSIWASNVREINGELSYELFATGSPFYSGTVLRSKDYKVISIKNSFGQTELRYKVYLKIKLAGRIIRARVTLANRQHNRFPILIGRRTLHNKFLVDVARRPMHKPARVLMLSTKRTKATKKFVENVQQKGKQFRITYAAYEDFCFQTGGSENRITLRDSGKDLATFDFVYFKTTSFMDVAAAMARYLKQRDIPFLDQAIRFFPGTSKLYQYVILTEHAPLAIPSSIYLLPPQLIESFHYLREQLELPFILKDIHGRKGQYNYLISDEQSFRTACVAAAKDGIHSIAQKFIANDRDYRVLVFEDSIELIIERSRQSDSTHLNNTSQGASARIVPMDTLPAEVQGGTIVAAKLLQRQIAGVDIIQDKVSGLWYCLEVNDGPQLATGKFTDEKQAAVATYLKRKLA